jgi:hypothetical protein
MSQFGKRTPWWAPGSGPVEPPIGARRAYAEVLGAFLGFFAAGVLAAAVLVGGRGQDLTPNGSWALYSIQVVSILSEIGLAVALVWLLGARRGITLAGLGLRVPRQADGRVAVSRGLRITGWSMFALVVGGVINAALQTGHLPTDKPSAPELIFGVFDALQAGIVEELVVLAFVVVTLRQARRPWWEITVVALVLRGSYHIYYGPGVVGILVWAALFYWIYLRFGELLPMVVCHILWDTVGFLSQRWAGVAAVAFLLVLALWIACPILWLVARNSQPVSVPAWAGAPHTWIPGQPGHPVQVASPAAPAVPPPGWHPDPGGQNRWRWWDGHTWTEHVSTH